MLITAYLTLGVTPPEPAELASAELDARLRARYLELVREVGPTAHPERFARIGAAYAQIATARERAKYALLGSRGLGTTREGLSALLTAVDEQRADIGLGALAAACEVTHG